VGEVEGLIKLRRELKISIRRRTMKAKIVAFMLLAVLLALATTPVYAAEALPGDANEDGAVNILDITKVERIIVGLDAETPGADANQDGKVNALDITKTEMIVAGMD
jgi:hypothetical protein